MFGVIGFYTLTFQNLDFTLYILNVFRFYFLKFRDVWILYSKISEFKDVKSKFWNVVKSKYSKCQEIKFKFWIFKM